MAIWTVSLDKPVAVEPPNAVAYVTYASDDARTIPGVRVPYALESDLLNFLARECARLSALDDRNSEMAAVVTGSALQVGPIALPDLTKQKALQAAQTAFDQKMATALIQPGTRFTKEQVADAIAADPTVATAQAALEAAQADAAKP